MEENGRVFSKAFPKKTNKMLKSGTNRGILLSNTREIPPITCFLYKFKSILKALRSPPIEMYVCLFNQCSKL